MRLLLSFLMPFMTFFTIGRPFAGIICLILQVTLIGWIPAIIWSTYALSQYKTDRKIENLLMQAISVRNQHSQDQEHVQIQLKEDNKFVSWFFGWFYVLIGAGSMMDGKILGGVIICLMAGLFFKIVRSRVEKFVKSRIYNQDLIIVVFVFVCIVIGLQSR